MRDSDKDQVKGLFHQIKGSAKVIVGKISGNLQLQTAGTGENFAGQIQQKIGQVKKLLGA